MYHLLKGSQYYAINNMEGNVISANTGKIIINVSNCIKVLKAIAPTFMEGLPD